MENVNSKMNSYEFFELLCEKFENFGWTEYATCLIRADILRELLSEDLIEFSNFGKCVKITEHGVGVHKFGHVGAEIIKEML